MATQEKSKLFKFLRFDAIIEHLTGLIEAKLELVKLELKEEVARTGARIIAGVVFSFLLIMIVIFMSLAMATFINQLLGNSYVGYFIVTSFYILVLVLLIAFKVHIWLQLKIEAMLIDTEEIDDNEAENE